MFEPTSYDIWLQRYQAPCANLSCGLPTSDAIGNYQQHVVKLCSNIKHLISFQDISPKKKTNLTQDSKLIIHLKCLTRRVEGPVGPVTQPLPRRGDNEAHDSQTPPATRDFDRDWSCDMHQNAEISSILVSCDLKPWFFGGFSEGLPGAWWDSMGQ